MSFNFFSVSQPAVLTFTLDSEIPFASSQPCDVTIQVFFDRHLSGNFKT